MEMESCILLRPRGANPPRVGWGMEKGGENYLPVVVPIAPTVAAARPPSWPRTPRTRAHGARTARRQREEPRRAAARAEARIRRGGAVPACQSLPIPLRTGWQTCRAPARGSQWDAEITVFNPTSRQAPL